MRAVLTNSYRPPVKSPTPDVPTIGASRFIAYVPIGLTSTNAATRSIGGDDVGQESFWTTILNTEIVPAIKAGAKRVLVQNPFGVVPGENMTWTQYLQAKAAGMNWLTDYFTAAMLVARSLGVEMIGYVGTTDKDPLLPTPQSAADQWQYQNHMVDSIMPFLNAGMSIAFDTAGGYWSDSAQFYVMKLIKACGVKVYVEPIAGRGPDGAELPQSAWPSITEENFFEQIEASNPSWATPLVDISGEVIRLISHPPAGKDWNDTSWLVPLIQKITSAGHTVCANAGVLIERKLALS